MYVDWEVFQLCCLQNSILSMLIQCCSEYYELVNRGRATATDGKKKVNQIMKNLEPHDYKKYIYIYGTGSIFILEQKKFTLSSEN